MQLIPTENEAISHLVSGDLPPIPQKDNHKMQNKDFTRFNQVILEAFDYADARYVESMGTIRTSRDYIVSLCDAHEAVIALEDVCSNIGDNYDIPIPVDLYERLKEACLYLEIDFHYWKHVRVLDQEQ